MLKNWVQPEVSIFSADQKVCRWTEKTRIWNSPFYAEVCNDWPLGGSEEGGDFVLIQTSYLSYVNHGCHRSGNGQGKKKFFKVREMSGNFILGEGKLAF